MATHPSFPSGCISRAQLGSGESIRKIQFDECRAKAAAILHGWGKLPFTGRMHLHELERQNQKRAWVVVFEVTEPISNSLFFAIGMKITECIGETICIAAMTGYRFTQSRYGFPHEFFNLPVSLPKRLCIGDMSSRLDAEDFFRFRVICHTSSQLDAEDAAKRQSWTPLRLTEEGLAVFSRLGISDSDFRLGWDHDANNGSFSPCHACFRDEGQYMLARLAFEGIQ
jgi:hypothetical protein